MRQIDVNVILALQAVMCFRLIFLSHFLLFLMNISVERYRSLNQWVHVLKRKQWKKSTKRSSSCGLHFKAEHYDLPVRSGCLQLKKNALSSVFEFPEHVIQNKVKERRERFANHI